MKESRIGQNNQQAIPCPLKKSNIIVRYLDFFIKKQYNINEPLKKGCR